MTSNSVEALIDPSQDASQRPTARFRITTDTMAPHICIGCGRSNTGSEEFVDLNRSYEWEGAQYLCVLCAQEIARTLLYVSPEALEVYNETYVGLGKELVAADERIAELESDLAAFESIRGLLVDLGRGDLLPSKVEKSADSVSAKAKS